MEKLYKNTFLIVSLGDITESNFDAVVNAANCSLLGGGGVDGAIHRAAGSRLHEECLAIRETHGPCRTGEAVITSGGNMKAKFVIHTVGPVWEDHTPEENDRLLSECYRNSLSLALENNLASIAFPAISTGIFGFPKARAARIAVRTVKEWIDDYPDAVRKIEFVCFDEASERLYIGEIGE